MNSWVALIFFTIPVFILWILDLRAMDHKIQDPSKAPAQATMVTLGLVNFVFWMFMGSSRTASDKSTTDPMVVALSSVVFGLIVITHILYIVFKLASPAWMEGDDIKGKYQTTFWSDNWSKANTILLVWFTVVVFGYGILIHSRGVRNITVNPFDGDFILKTNSPPVPRTASEKTNDLIALKQQRLAQYQKAKEDGVLSDEGAKKITRLKEDIQNLKEGLELL